jgi:single-stranded DNA-binding protein
MTSYNRVILTGKVMTPPQRQYRPDGSPVIQFPLELNDAKTFPDSKGQNRILVVAVGELAEYDLDLLQSGQPLMVVGRLHQRHWKTPEGIQRNRLEVIATEFRTVDENPIEK